ncbi:MAG TPA: Stp1/IreP family PP2C-type Ser/Thr phosphatase [Gaiellaceae bacterium]|nr:Stp1/IreP family PP2C-type Ser/Thr phosphatase [Gaiellaceae bacterium]
MPLGRHTALSDTGRKRRRNEDAYVVRPPLFAVADGMGGAQAGEVASRLAVEALAHGDADVGGEERVTALIQEANRRIYRHAGEDAATSGMGTTMTVALVEDGGVVIGHVGDSRAYLVRDGELRQLTDDHSLVGELIRSGKLTPDEAESHPQRSVITRALGSDPDVDVDTFTVEAQPGDVFLICSDGLTSMVGDEAILRAVKEHHDDLDAAARELVRLANRGGGEDNITVVCFEIAEQGATPDETAVLAATEAPAADDDEDTLDELDGVPAVAADGTGRPPAVDTMVVPVSEVEAAAEAEAPTPRRRRSRQDETAKRVLATVLVLVVLAAIVLLVVWGLLR